MEKVIVISFSNAEKALILFFSGIGVEFDYV